MRAALCMTVICVAFAGAERMSKTEGSGRRAPLIEQSYSASMLRSRSEARQPRMASSGREPFGALGPAGRWASQGLRCIGATASRIV